MKAHFTCFLFAVAQKFTGTPAASPVSELPGKVFKQAAGGLSNMVPPPWHYGMPPPMYGYPRGAVNGAWPFPPPGAFPYPPYWLPPAAFDQPGRYRAPPRPNFEGVPMIPPFPDPQLAAASSEESSAPIPTQEPTSNTESSPTEELTTPGESPTSATQEPATPGSKQEPNIADNETVWTAEDLHHLIDELEGTKAENKASTQIAPIEASMSSATANTSIGAIIWNTVTSERTLPALSETPNDSGTPAATPEAGPTDGTTAGPGESQMAATSPTNDSTGDSTGGEQTSTKSGQDLTTSDSSASLAETGSTAEGLTVVPQRYKGSDSTITNSTESTEANPERAPELSTESDNVTVTGSSPTDEQDGTESVEATPANLPHSLVVITDDKHEEHGDEHSTKFPHTTDEEVITGGSSLDHSENPAPSGHPHDEEAQIAAETEKGSIQHLKTIPTGEELANLGGIAILMPPKEKVWLYTPEKKNGGDAENATDGGI